MERSMAARFHDAATQFRVYEDYLDSRVTPKDLFYFKGAVRGEESGGAGRRGREERPFLRQEPADVSSNPDPRRNKKRKFCSSRGQDESGPRGLRLSTRSLLTLASAGKELKDNFLRALAEREEANRSGKMSSVIFIRDHNPLGREVSGYIDYAHRLKTQDFEPYFSGKKKLVPRRSDLCYYNWKTQVSTSNSSPNFEVIYDDPNGLLFKNKMDKKILNVDPLVGKNHPCAQNPASTSAHVRRGSEPFQKNLLIFGWFV
uniref:Cilia- and flagella-associated protein 299 n=1 Tax=Cyclopterus lumpus TaxID=8103 RepID=A0A8C2XMG6_CYCLU